MTALEVGGLTKSYGPVPVLRGLDLTVAEGSLTAVLGASGSGKTTLLRVVAGFERIQAGTVSIAGRVVDDRDTHVPAEKRRLGYVAQEGALFPHLSVAGNVAFGLRRGTGRRARVVELLELVGLEGLGSRYPHELSGGQQQRVALARALALAPPVVLLDEPFASLDAALRGAVRSDIAAILRAAGTTVVLVTHDQDEALSMADHVAVLRDGRVAQHGTPHSLYTDPVDAPLAAFLGAANLLAADIRGGVAMTPLGRLQVRGDLASGPAVVLVRPEQIALAPGVGLSGGGSGEVSGGGTGEVSGGVRGRVVATEYHGHDALLRVAPHESFGTEVLIVRTHDGASYPVGAEVTLRASGQVRGWNAPPPSDR